MNKRHPAFTSELEAAVSCWQALFADAPPGKVATHTKSKATSWLKQNRPTLDKSQRGKDCNRLDTRFKEKGGAPPTPRIKNSPPPEKPLKWGFFVSSTPPTIHTRG